MSTLPHAISSIVERAGLWLLTSGIREADGGVARYHFADRQQNAKVSTEITGYAVSAFSYLHHLTKEQRYLDAAVLSARFLCDKAWDDDSNTMPFEIPAPGEQAYAYFFDLGIIVRGLLAAHRIAGDTTFLARAKQVGLSMAYDFMADEAVHPILALPDKQPLDYDSNRWSRCPGCYQLKSALAWKDLADITGQPALKQPYERMLEYSLATHESFLPGHSDPAKVMDRLHAYCYFLEAILPVAGDRPAVAEALRSGIAKVSALLREIRPKFERSDVNAQLLRVRIWADRMGIVRLNGKEAADEARAIAEFSREEDGGYWFGRVNNGKEFLPFTNPVSASFCLQALAMWEGDRDIPVTSLI